MKTISYGVLLLNEHGQLLIAHATGTRHWDIPKGGADAGEAPVEAALRELLEETGVVIDAAVLVDLGRMRYIAAKDLHLFMTHVVTADVDIGRCVCTSYFEDRRTGRSLPEADAFMWADQHELPKRCTASMAAVLKIVLGGLAGQV